MLVPKETGFLDFLSQHGIDIERRATPKIDTEKYIHKMHQIILKDHILEKNARGAYKATIAAYQQHTLKKYFNVKDLPLADVGKCFCLADTAPQVNVIKSDGERAPYVNGMSKSRYFKVQKLCNEELSGSFFFFFLNIFVMNVFFCDSSVV